MNPESLELQIERAHDLLSDKSQPVYLGCGGLSLGHAPFGSSLVGYYRHGVKLLDFRADVYAEYDARCGR